jgi:rhodanese-related sulfurtransferase
MMNMSTSIAPPKAVPLPISAATARRRRGVGALLVDIRPQVARHQGSIPDAVVVDPGAIVSQFNLDSPQRISGLDCDCEIVVCSVSSGRAIPIAEHLTRLGYHHVYYLAGGYGARQDWHRNR